MSKGRKNGIPDRWLEYKAVGKRLEGTRFIAFKVPLKESLNRRLPHEQVFGHWELLDAMEMQNQELGLIIDLTFTRRYYTPEDVPWSLWYVKILTAGHEIPTDRTILSFKRAVRRFLRDNADNDRLIGVHCTHGLNRAGYLICRYLIDVDGMEPDAAIQLFNAGRGHDIERLNYLRDLRCGAKRGNHGMDEADGEPVRGGAVFRPCLQPEDRREEEDEWRAGGRNATAHRHHPDVEPPWDANQHRRPPDVQPWWGTNQHGHHPDVEPPWNANQHRLFFARRPHRPSPYEVPPPSRRWSPGRRQSLPGSANGVPLLPYTWREPREPQRAVRCFQPAWEEPPGWSLHR